MKMWLAIISIGLIVLIAGCVKEKPKEVQFKNDVITIENFVVSNIAPYSTKEDSKPEKVDISFDIKNNGDKPVKWVTVIFFDTPGFEIIDDCSIFPRYTLKTKEEICICADDTLCSKGSEISFSLECRKFGDLIPDSDDERSCTFGDPTADPTTLDVIDPLDTRSVKFTVKTRKGITSPTPFTISFSVTYRYGSVQQAAYFFSGERTAIIPVIDPNFKKEPSSKFSQSDPTIGPIVFDTVPSLEREKVVDGKTIKEYWGIVGRAFQTKFVMKKIVSEGTLKDILNPNPPIGPPVSDCRTLNGGCIGIQLTNLKIDETTGTCNFIPTTATKDKGIAKITVNEKNNTLVCGFAPTNQSGFTSEFIGTITIQYNYDYEIVRKQNFVVYPAIS